MTRSRFRVAIAVYGIVHDNGRLLLIRRAGSGYHDGELSLPAGHVDGREDVRAALVRELAEELTITVNPDDCRLSLTAHRATEHIDDDEYVDFFFTVDRWTGTPAIGEPTKCTELVWTDPRQLPLDVIDYIKTVIQACSQGESLVLVGWDPTPPK